MKIDIVSIHIQRAQRWENIKNNLFALHGIPYKSALALDDLLEHDISNTNSYHNPQHMKAVALRAYDSMYFLPFEREKNRSFTDTRLITFLAASLHDLQHKGGVGEDYKNIEDTISKVSLFLTIEAGVLADYSQEIIDTIKDTQYPYTKDPNTFSGKLIRDCDLLMCVEPDWPYWLEGLNEELGKNITPVEQMEWVLEQKFFFEYHRELVERRYREYIGLY